MRVQIDMKKLVLFLVATIFMSCANSQNEMQKDESAMTTNNDNLELATFGAGCFWCVEAIFQDLKGVEKVTSGYSGGDVKNPSYREVCTGRTGHAEVVQIQFNPDVISFKELLEVFWQTHDPTTLNKQGADVGTQYRSAVFYHDQSQKELAEEYKKKLDESEVFDDPIVTEISQYDTFYKAEVSHQDYYNENSDAPYCRAVITPKVEKFRKVFEDKLKEDVK